MFCILCPTDPRKVMVGVERTTFIFLLCGQLRHIYKVRSHCARYSNSQHDQQPEIGCICLAS